MIIAGCRPIPWFAGVSFTAPSEPILVLSRVFNTCTSTLIDVALFLQWYDMVLPPKVIETVREWCSRVMESWSLITAVHVTVSGSEVFVWIVDSNTFSVDNRGVILYFCSFPAQILQKGLPKSCTVDHTWWSGIKKYVWTCPTPV